MDPEVGYSCSETQTLVTLDDLSDYSDTELKDKSSMTFRVLREIIKADGFRKELTTMKFAGIVHFLTAAFKDSSSVSLTKLFKELRDGGKLDEKLRSEVSESLDPEMTSDVVVKEEDGTYGFPFPSSVSSYNRPHQGVPVPRISTESYFVSEELDDGNAGQQGSASEAKSENKIKDQSSLVIQSTWTAAENYKYNGEQISSESSNEDIENVEEPLDEKIANFRVKEESIIEEGSYLYESNDSYEETAGNDSVEEGGHCPLLKMTPGGNLHMFDDVGRTGTKEKLPLCKVCGRKFHNSSNLNRHMRLHTGEKPFQCSACGKRFSDQGNLQTHRVVHSEQKPFVCTVCGRRFRWKNVLERHMTTHTKDIPYICHVCGFTCTQRAHFSRHCISEHSETFTETSDSGIGDTLRGQDPSVLDDFNRRGSKKKLPECKVCGRKFHNSSNLSRHMRLHTGEKPFQCSTCGKRFSDQGNLQSHRVVHSGEKPYMCTVCGKRFRWKNILKGHVITHTGERPYVCHICGVTCTRRPILARHMLKHSETHTEASDNSSGDMPAGDAPSAMDGLNIIVSKRKLPECNVCGRKFHNSSNLNRHMRLHTGEKPFQCSTCGKLFSDQGNLQNHTVVHSGEKPYICTVCGKGFKWKNVLDHHIFIHTKEKPHMCHVCGWGCTRKAELTIHLAKHTGEYPYSCRVCGKGFSRARSLDSHMTRHRAKETLLEGCGDDMKCPAGDSETLSSGSTLLALDS